MRDADLQAQVGYGRRRPKAKAGALSVVAPDHLQQQFNVEQPDKAWVTNITYIRTHEGRLFLAVVLDLFSHLVIGWAMQPRMERDLVISALLIGCVTEKAQEQGHHPLRPRESVYQPRVAVTFQGEHAA